MSLKCKLKSSTLLLAVLLVSQLVDRWERGWRSRIGAVEWDLFMTEKRVGLETCDTPTGSP